MPRRNVLNGYYALRWKILERDNFTCQYCGQKAPDVKLEVDHRVPVAEEGNDDPENLVTSCYACNRGKSGLSIMRKRRKSPKSFIPLLPKTYRQDEALTIVQQSPGLTTNELAQRLNISRNNADAVTMRLRKRDKVIKREERWYSFGYLFPDHLTVR